jgi:Ca2+-binding RTX toxin-like protein
VFGQSGDDTIDGGAGSDTIDGGGDTDTVLGYGAGYSLAIVGGKWVVTNGTDTDVLTNVEKVTIGTRTYILVDSFADGGFGSVQDAISSASGGETILIAPGSYTEQMQYQGGSEIGLVIDKSVILQGVDSDGNFITNADDVAADIISGAQSWWGTNFFVTANNVEIYGLKFTAADGSFYNQGDEVNKAFEIVGNGFKMQFNLVGAADGVNVASTIYINDDTATFPGFVSDITSFLIDQNIFEGAVVVTNGPGEGHPIATIDFKITNNEFVMNPGSDPGYNWGIILNGREATIPWRIASIVLPEITGNTFTSDYAIYLRALDDDPAKTPDRAYVDAFIANNITGDYAFAAEADGDPQLNASSANRFYIHNAIDAAVGDAVSGGNVVFRVAADTSYTVDKDGLTFDAQDGSGAISLTLGTANDVNLAGDQNVSVFGNGNANTINGNEADNFIGGAGGDDTINGGAGSDTIDAGGGTDTVAFDADYADLTITRIGASSNYIVTNSVTGETDTVLNVENFTIDGHTVSATSAVTNAAPTITSVLDSDTNSATLLVNENAAAGTGVANVSATDPNSVLDSLTYSLLNTDNSAFTGPFEIDATGAIKVKTGAVLNFESTSSFTFKVQVTDAHGNTDTETVTVNLSDLNDNAPVFTSGTIANVNENVAANSTVYTAAATDADTSFGGVSYTLANTGDFAAFTVNSTTGAVTINASPDRETKSSYTFTVVATQGSTSTSRTVTLGVNDLNDNNPVFTNPSFTPNIAENSLTSVVAFDANATDADTTLGAISYTLTGADASKLTINTSTGEVRLISGADFEVQNQYLFNVVATQGSSSSSHAVVLSVTDVDEPRVPSPLGPSVEAGSRQASLGLDAGTDPDGPQTFTVVSLPAQGTLFLNGVAVTVNQVLTEAQFEALTYTAPETAGSFPVQFTVTDGSGSDPVNFNIDVDAAQSKTYNGTASADRLDGAGGNDVINGGGGIDLMIGGTGNDTFIVAQSHDKVDEVGGNGIDLVRASVSYNLGNTALVKGAVENLQLSGFLAVAGIGNNLANVITGSAGANTLIGNGGSDTLNGRQGNDILAGGAGNDAFVFNVLPTAGNLDKITDFSNAPGNNDVFHLEGSLFTGLGANGTLNSALFFAGAAAHDANDRVVYNKTTGAVFYDVNGNAAGGSFQIATVLNKPTLTAADFVVI